MLGRYRGCMIGSAIGDVVGAPFEGENLIDKYVLQDYFATLNKPPRKKIFYYTDDTAMTRSVAQSLIHSNGFNEVDMAKKFVKEYFKEPHRGYGGNVVNVFKELKESRFVDVYAPASTQFNGSGSYGNGGAMRVAPVALFYKNVTEMMEVAKKSALITHSNPLGCNGTVLQCLAVYRALHHDKTSPLQSTTFVDNLIKDIETVDENSEYESALIKVKDLEIDNVSKKSVVSKLGNDISAYKSVPTAIYCFLRETTFEDTLHYAISLGGDTDTIASMAGAIAGAYYGEKEISSNMMKYCEGVYNAAAQADCMYELVHQS